MNTQEYTVYEGDLELESCNACTNDEEIDCR